MYETVYNVAFAMKFVYIITRKQITNCVLHIYCVMQYSTTVSIPLKFP